MYPPNKVLKAHEKKKTETREEGTSGKQKK